VLVRSGKGGQWPGVIAAPLPRAFLGRKGNLWHIKCQGRWTAAVFRKHLATALRAWPCSCFYQITPGSSPYNQSIYYQDVPLLPPRAVALRKDVQMPRKSRVRSDTTPSVLGRACKHSLYETQRVLQNHNAERSVCQTCHVPLVPQ